MNMDDNPTVEQLRAMIRQCDDTAGHHILWVGKDGKVNISRVPKDSTPVGFEDANPDMQVRCETFQAGNEYVGPEAADDDGWVTQLFNDLTQKWHKAKGKPTVEYIDSF